jgi:hypothetical protein
MSELTEKELRDNQSDISIQQKYTYLEQIRDYTYKDVVLADTKASFALTIVAFSLAALGALFDEIMHVKDAWKMYVDFFWISGLFFSGISVFSAMLTILPRSYISHEISNNPNSWIHLHPNRWGSIKRRLLDAYYVIAENFWQKQTKGTSQSLNMLINSDSNEVMINNLYESMLRALLVQNLKFLWVGKALLFAFLSFSFIVTSLFLTLIASTDDKTLYVTSIEYNGTKSQVLAQINKVDIDTKKQQDELEKKFNEMFMTENDKLYFLQIDSSESFFTLEEKKRIFKKYHNLLEKYSVKMLIERRINIKTKNYFCIGVELREDEAQSLQKDLVISYNKESILYN